MFALGVLIGLFAYSIFLLGIFSLLYPIYIAIISILFFILLIFILKKNIHLSYPSFSNIDLVLFGLFLIQACINLVGALGPEISFDALWYHLTIPKLFLLHHSVYYIPGGPLYYSPLPKIAEMLYIPALTFGNEITTKLIQYIFGILCCVAIYKLSRKFLPQTYSILAVIIFYSNLVVGWESITAYVDLTRTFFEILAFWSFYIWIKNLEQKWLYTTALFVGFAITTKLIAFSSLIIFLILLLFRLVEKKDHAKKIAWNVLLFCAISLCIPLPWFIFSYIHTGNPVYPIFSGYPTHFSLWVFNPLKFITDVFALLTHAADPISPVYIAIIPLLFFIKKQMQQQKYIALYCAIALCVWYITPQTGGGRFILPYLPVFSLFASFVVSETKKANFYKALLLFCIFVAGVSISYRATANAKFIPILIRRETKATFLTHHLNFSFGDFYDTDGYFTKTIKPTDNVLLFGFHNEYYVDFPYVDDSWLKSTDIYNYIAVQNGSLPTKYKNWKLQYVNTTTHVQLYASQ